MTPDWKIGAIQCLAVALFLGPASADSRPCQTLQVLNAKIRPTIERIQAPGNYCLEQEIRQEMIQRKFSGTRLNLEGSFFLSLIGSDIELNLQGHTIRSNFQSLHGRGENGLTAELHRDNNVGRYYSPRRLTLRNGTIVLAGISEGVRIPRMALQGSVYSDTNKMQGRPQETKAQGSGVVPTVRTRLESVLSNEDTLIEIHNMTIKSGLTGITIMGRRNTIRNSRIEVNNPRAGIYLFGANNLIENNILIFTGEALNDSAAPIKLHAGHGTIIRNNIIILDTPKPRQAISLIESRDVELSHNRVYGASVLVRRFDKNSSFESARNELLDRPATPLINRQHRRADSVLVK